MKLSSSVQFTPIADERDVEGGDVEGAEEGHLPAVEEQFESPQAEATDRAIEERDEIIRGKFKNQIIGAPE
jgi:hypothetical protein